MIQESFQGSEEEFTGFKRVYRVQENIQGSREFTGFRRIYWAQERRLQGLVEFTGFSRVYRSQESLQGSGEISKSFKNCYIWKDRYIRCYINSGTKKGLVHKKDWYSF